MDFLISHWSYCVSIICLIAIIGIIFSANISIVNHFDISNRSTIEFVITYVIPSF